MGSKRLRRPSQVNESNKIFCRFRLIRFLFPIRLLSITPYPFPYSTLSDLINATIGWAEAAGFDSFSVGPETIETIVIEVASTCLSLSTDLLMVRHPSLF